MSTNEAMEMCSALTDSNEVFRFTPLAALFGRRLHGIKLRLTLDELYRPDVERWIRSSVVCRKADPREPIVIEIYPP